MPPTAAPPHCPSSKPLWSFTVTVTTDVKFISELRRVFSTLSPCLETFKILFRWVEKQPPLPMLCQRPTQGHIVPSPALLGA